MKIKTIAQWIYGSTPWSAGYSILAKTESLDSSFIDDTLSYCENYDRQRHVLPNYDYSFCIYSLKNGICVLLEIFNGWKDQVGRESRIMRNILFDAEAWRLTKGNPLILSWMLPSLSLYIPKKRNDVSYIPEISLETLQKEQHRLWHKETKHFFKILSSLGLKEKKLLFSLQEEDCPFSPREIAVDNDASRLARAIVYAMDKEKRMACQIDSFSLNDELPKGLCFRFSPYCKENRSIHSFDSKATPAISLQWEMSTLVHSIPEPELFYVLQKRYTRFSVMPYLLFMAFLILLYLYITIGK